MRSYKTAEESEIVFTFNPVKVADADNEQSKIGQSSGESNLKSCIALLKELIPPNTPITSRTREMLQNVLSWQILPSDAPLEPSMIYGSVHLSRLIGGFSIFSR